MKNPLNCRYLLPAVVGVLAAAGCGGGSAPSPTTAEGQYQNETDGSALYILDNGTFYLLYPSSTGTFAAIFYGTGTSTKTTFSGSATRFTYSGDLYKSSVEVSGTYSYHASLNLTTGATFSGTFVPGFLTPAKQTDVTGSYVDANAQQAMMIDASGDLVINDFTISPCTITGTVHPHGNDDVYDATLNFGGTCAIINKSGIAIPNGNSLLFVMNDGYYLRLRKVS